MSKERSHILDEANLIFYVCGASQEIERLSKPMQFGKSEFQDDFNKIHYALKYKKKTIDIIFDKKNFVPRIHHHKLTRQNSSSNNNDSVLSADYNMIMKHDPFSLRKNANTESSYAPSVSSSSNKSPPSSVSSSSFRFNPRQISSKLYDHIKKLNYNSSESSISGGSKTLISSVDNNALFYLVLPDGHAHLCDFLNSSSEEEIINLKQARCRNYCSISLFLKKLRLNLKLRSSEISRTVKYIERPSLPMRENFLIKEDILYEQLSNFSLDFSGNSASSSEKSSTSNSKSSLADDTYEDPNNYIDEESNLLEHRTVF
jgi:hypothetical protein